MTVKAQRSAVHYVLSPKSVEPFMICTELPNASARICKALNELNLIEPIVSDVVPVVIRSCPVVEVRCLTRPFCSEGQRRPNEAISNQ
jgi:hypothetical protein